MVGEIQRGTYAYRGKLLKLETCEHRHAKLPVLVPEDVYERNINLTRSLLAHLLLSVRKLTSSYTAVQACAVYAAVALIIFAAVEVFLDVLSVPPNSSWSGTARHLTCDLLLLSDAAVQTVQYRLVLSDLHVVRISHVLRITFLQPLCTIAVCILYNSRMFSQVAAGPCKVAVLGPCAPIARSAKMIGNRRASAQYGQVRKGTCLNLQAGTAPCRPRHVLFRTCPC